jgi:D-serine dehydratase
MAEGGSLTDPLDPILLSVPGIGAKGQPLKVRAAASYSLIEEELSLPIAVLRASALAHNIDWMQRFAAHHQVKLCPHGKTSMTPAMFRQQLDQGAWGITVATAAQAQVAAMAGARHILLANQLVGRTNMAIIAELAVEHGIEIFCCVDSLVNAQALNAFFAAHQASIQVLIELGVAGGRCGCRSAEEARSLAQHIATLPHVALAGIEVYEGVIHGDDAHTQIRTFLTEAVALAGALRDDGLIQAEPIVTGAGSAWYDVVAECFSAHPDFRAVIRPGCYVIHDKGIYQDAQEELMRRAERNGGYACHLDGDLESALELWAYVISRPEPTQVIVGLGKRDAAFDAGLPQPERGYRQGQPISVTGAVPERIMDQHLLLKADISCELQVGDIVVFSTSHPCLTMDKWRAVAVCDDQDRVMQWMTTYF